MLPVIAAAAGGLLSFIGISLIKSGAAGQVVGQASLPDAGPSAGPIPEPVSPPPPQPPSAADLGLKPIQSTNIAPHPDGSGLSQLKTNPDGSPHTLGTPFVDTSTQAALAAADLANKLGLASFEVELLKTGGKLARVTTNDPPPAGDLIIRTAPDVNAPQVDGGGAEKDGTVTIIRDVDSVFSEVFWRGGDRRPLAQGFAKRAFLRILPNPLGL